MHKQVDRLLSNDAIGLEAFFSHWVPYTFGARPEVVALDWTSFARDGHDTLVLSVLDPPWPCDAADVEDGALCDVEGEPDPV